jgi:hypothetical protein
MRIGSRTQSRLPNTTSFVKRRNVAPLLNKPGRTGCVASNLLIRPAPGSVGFDNRPRVVTHEVGNNASEDRLGTEPSPEPPSWIFLPQISEILPLRPGPRLKTEKLTQGRLRAKLGASVSRRSAQSNRNIH